MEESMKQIKSQSASLSWAGVWALLLVTGAVPAGFAQQARNQSAVSAASSQAPVTARPVDEAQTTAKPVKAGEQGIRIHGHWVMDIKNPDGTLVRHLDFENSLVTAGYVLSGDQLLGLLLSGNASVSDPAIAFVPTSAVFDSDPTQWCAYDAGFPASVNCPVLTTARSLYSVAGAGTTPQIGLQSALNFGTSVNWKLSGNFTVPSGLTSISDVQTLIPACVSSAGQPFTVLFATDVRSSGNTFSGVQAQGQTGDGYGTLAPSACTVPLTGISTASNTPFYFAFTSTQVPNAPLVVTPGQVITVTVTISFS